MRTRPETVSTPSTPPVSVCFLSALVETSTRTDSAGFGQVERATTSLDLESTRRMPTLKRPSFILPRPATWAVRPCQLSPAIPHSLTCSWISWGSRSWRSRELYSPGALAGARTRSRSRRVAQEHGSGHIEEQERREGQRWSLEERQEDPYKSRSSSQPSLIHNWPSKSFSLVLFTLSLFAYLLYRHSVCFYKQRAPFRLLSSPQVP